MTPRRLVRTRRPRARRSPQLPPGVSRSSQYGNEANNSLRGAVHAHGIEMRHDLLDVHDIDVFVMQVEQIDLVRELGAVERALFHRRNLKAAGIAVDHARAHAPRRALPAYDQTLNS